MNKYYFYLGPGAKAQKIEALNLPFAVNLFSEKIYGYVTSHAIKVIQTSPQIWEIENFKGLTLIIKKG